MTARNEDRIAELVRSGRITDLEGRRLIDALREQPSSWRLPIDPFNRLSTPALWSVAALVVVASCAVSQLGIRFDGALDLHAVTETPSLLLALFDNANAILSTAGAMWLVGLAISRQGRLADFALFVTVARAPQPIVGFMIALLMPPPDEVLAQISSGAVDPQLILLSIGLTLPGLIWFLVLLFFAFKTSSGLRGIRLGFGFAISLILAEIISKLVLIADPATGVGL